MNACMWCNVHRDKWWETDQHFSHFNTPTMMRTLSEIKGLVKEDKVISVVQRSIVEYMDRCAHVLMCSKPKYPIPSTLLLLCLLHLQPSLIRTPDHIFSSPLQSCAEPNLQIKYSKRAASESIWYVSFNLVRQKH